jgi:hypothetical protein
MTRFCLGSVLLFHILCDIANHKNPLLRIHSTRATQPPNLHQKWPDFCKYMAIIRCDRNLLTAMDRIQEVAGTETRQWAGMRD